MRRGNVPQILIAAGFLVGCGHCDARIDAQRLYPHADQTAPIAEALRREVAASNLESVFIARSDRVHLEVERALGGCSALAPRLESNAFADFEASFGAAFIVPRGADALTCEGWVARLDDLRARVVR